MKIYKKILSAFIGSTLVLAMACCLSACSNNILDNDIAGTVNSAVVFPEQYSIAYEVEDVAGVVRTVSKTVDADGNVYFMSGRTEKLFIKDGNLYELYQRDANGEFRAMGVEAAYNQTYVDSETAEFLAFAEQSKKQFIPGMENSGEEKILERTCLVYGVKLGSDNTGVSYSFYVDKETGICLGFESSKFAAGIDLGVDDTVYICTEFITEDISPLTDFLPGESVK